MLTHVFLLLDGSGSMQQIELRTGEQKHKAIALTVQSIIDALYYDPGIGNTLLTVICYDSNKVNDVRIHNYDVKAETYYQQKNLDLWDPVIGHGGTTPIGRALKYGRELAEKWVNDAIGEESRRAVIYLISDGMLFPPIEPDGSHEVAKIFDFNSNSKKGRIRLYTVGYFQYEEGTSEAINSGEDEGRKLLRSLPENPKAYIEKSTAEEIFRYITSKLIS